MALLGIIVCGLAVAQLVAVLHIWISNQNLYNMLSAMNAAGYFPIPTSMISPPLTSIKAAIFGGFFFTLTLGAALTLFCVAAVCLASATARKNDISRASAESSPQTRFKLFFTRFSKINAGAAVCVFFWIYLLLKLNSEGVCAVESLYFIVIPLVVAPLTYLWGKSFNFKFRRTHLLFLSAWLAPVVILTLIWTTQWDENLFIRIRDHLLLENRVGRAINDFYYRYTLYPAETFKPLSQKMLKTCYLADITPPEKASKIETLLRYQDYLALSTPDSAEMIVIGNGPNLSINTQKGSPVEVSVNDFISGSNSVLEKLSQQKDTKNFFRYVTFYSLIFGFPVVLYAFLFGLLFLCLQMVTRPVKAVVATSILCFLAGLALFRPVWQSEVPAGDIADLGAALSSQHWRIRLSALQKICDEEIEIEVISNYQKSKESSHIPERYWLARALAVSKGPDTYADLVKLSQDSHPNVQCQALYGLGRRKHQTAIGYIYNTIKKSDHWYVQWYGYKALRSLGWVQPRSELKLF